MMKTAKTGDQINAGPVLQDKRAHLAGLTNTTKGPAIRGIIHDMVIVATTILEPQIRKTNDEELFYTGSLGIAFPVFCL